MRKFESWMKKGAPVIKSGYEAEIKTYSISKVGRDKMVHSMTIQFKGVDKPYPVNANDVNPVNHMQYANVQR